MYVKVAWRFFLYILLPPPLYIYILPCFPNLKYKFLYQQNQLRKSRCEGSNVACISRRVYRQTSNIGNQSPSFKDICVQMESYIWISNSGYEAFSKQAR